MHPNFNWQKIRSASKHSNLWKKKESLKRRSCLGRNPLLKLKKVSNVKKSSEPTAGDATESNALLQKIRESNGRTGLHEGNEESAKTSGILALDCEMVGVGPNGKRDALARVSIVNFEGDVVYDSYVNPGERVRDYRTKFSGIIPIHLVHAPSFEKVQKDVFRLVQDKILVLHSSYSDLHALMLKHSRRLIRDTATYKKLCPNRPRKLKDLASEHLHVTIQSGSHDSVEDARVAMALYRVHSKAWEKHVAMVSRRKANKNTTK